MPEMYDPDIVRAVCSSLSKACTKQFRTREAQLFDKLAAWYEQQAASNERAALEDLEKLIQDDLITQYPYAAGEAENLGDRGAQRALLWGKKVTSLQKSLIARFKKQRSRLFDEGPLHVCEACGFISVGPEAPSICPICKAPASRFSAIS